MKILFLSPQPFYQERGTAIAIDLLLKSLSERGHSVDLLTFHVGEDLSYDGVSIKRIRPFFPPKSIKPGFSLKKVYCDLFLSWDAFKAMRKGEYDYIHAVEEASYIAMLLSKVFRVPFVYDMDSSMATQMVDQFRWLRPFRRLIDWFESLPMRTAMAVVPMCEDLADRASEHCNGIVHVLKDVSLLANRDDQIAEDIRTELNIEGPILMYVGNLEWYQGIDLLLDSFAKLAETNKSAELVIIGGSREDIDKYRRKATALEIASRVHLVGPRPVADLGHYLRQADILVSPRIHGTNTPMKIYSYLDSGVVVLATDLPTHTQVMSASEAALVPADADAVASRMIELLDDPSERQRLSENARQLIRREHSWDAFHSSVGKLFSELDLQLAQRSRP